MGKLIPLGVTFILLAMVHDLQNWRMSDYNSPTVWFLDQNLMFLIHSPYKDIIMVFLLSSL